MSAKLLKSLLLALAMLSPQALADTATLARLAIQGHVLHPTKLTLADLKAMKPVTIEVTHEAGHGEPHAFFTGVLLWSLIGAASPIDEPGGRTFLRHTILATGADGYAVALAIGEIVPGLEAKQVLVAIAQDGKELATPRLIVPLDAKAGRSVKDLVTIDVR